MATATDSSSTSVGSVTATSGHTDVVAVVVVVLVVAVVGRGASASAGGDRGCSRLEEDCNDIQAAASSGHRQRSLARCGHLFFSHLVS